MISIIYSTPHTPLVYIYTFILKLKTTQVCSCGYLLYKLRRYWLSDLEIFFVGMKIWSYRKMYVCNYTAY